MKGAWTCAAVAAAALSHGQVDVTFDPASGLYQVFEKRTGYRLTGTLAQPATSFRSADKKLGKQTLHEISFQWNPGTRVEGTISWLQGGSTVWFGLRYLKAAPGHGYNFPDFTAFPTGLHRYSFRDTTFAPPSFKLNETSTPWLFFDDTARSFILSPASEFLIAKMRGDGDKLLAVGLNDRLTAVPPGTRSDSLLAFGEGIGQAWDAWGAALRGRYRRQEPDAASDPLLKKFGYWTDNGADYYYNYDPSRGYAGTLIDLKDRYSKEQIPLGYLQLDSWWYQKTIDGADGKPGGATKNARLPAETWNRYGGTYLYEASPELFPSGLPAFQKDLGLPLAVHARWIDRTSPYHSKYRFSGVGSVDPRWWDHVAEYLKAAGVVCYEQDWLDHIYEFSPDMASKAGVADAFANGMADACRKTGLTMQYCMATPRFFLQGVKYGNLTTIRTSDDRFERSRWHNFLFTSQLAQEVGIAPWCDVFKSRELGNLVLSVLSAGPVGTGDRIGAEVRDNILKAVRADGVIIRPDRPIVPIDASYLDEAAGRSSPIVASTYTASGGLQTRYVFAFARSHGDLALRVKPSDAGFEGRGYLYDFSAGTGAFVDSSSVVRSELDPDGYGYWMIAPVSKSGFVLLGDLSKIVPTGKQRIPEVEDRADALIVHVALGAGEKSAVLEGVSRAKPKISGDGSLQHWDPDTGRFQFLATGEKVILSVAR